MATAFLKADLLVPGKTALISPGGLLSPTAISPAGDDVKAWIIFCDKSSALALPPKARKAISRRPSSRVRST
eukprot:scaffold8953_cov171-Amphora_coffeaeformis.AAC.4